MKLECELIAKAANPKLRTNNNTIYYIENNESNREKYLDKRISFEYNNIKYSGQVVKSFNQQYLLISKVAYINPKESGYANRTNE